MTTLLVPPNPNHTNLSRSPVDVPPPVDPINDGVDHHGKSKPMHSEHNRLQSFINWPCSFVNPRDLAKEGFYYTQSQDIVRCAFCDLQLAKWEPGDVPSSDHRSWSSHCPMVEDRECGNVPLEAIADEISYDTCGNYGIHFRATSLPENTTPKRYEQYAIRTQPPSSPHYATLESRLRSFADWPVSIKQKPHDLASAGFYYSGKSDQTVCFSCGGGLKSWEPNDDPWEQHAIWFSKCAYLRLCKSPEFIESFADKAQEAMASMPALVKSKPSTSPPTATSALTSTTSVECINKTVAESTLTTTSEPSVAKPATTTSLGTSPPSKDSQTQCKICFSKEVGVVFLPCGHMIACVDCAPALTKCGVCRRELEATVRAFLS